MAYKSKRLYSAEPFVDMGIDMVRVKDENGMVGAILTTSAFDEMYEFVPDPDPVELPPANV